MGAECNLIGNKPEWPVETHKVLRITVKPYKCIAPHLTMWGNMKIVWNIQKGIVHILGYKSCSNGLLPIDIYCSDFEEIICYGNILEL